MFLKKSYRSFRSGFVLALLTLGLLGLTGCEPQNNGGAFNGYRYSNQPDIYRDTSRQPYYQVPGRAGTLGPRDPRVYNNYETRDAYTGRRLRGNRDSLYNDYDPEIEYLRQNCVPCSGDEIDQFGDPYDYYSRAQRDYLSGVTSYPRRGEVRRRAQSRNRSGVGGLRTRLTRGLTESLGKGLGGSLLGSFVGNGRSFRDARRSKLRRYPYYICANGYPVNPQVTPFAANICGSQYDTSYHNGLRTSARHLTRAYNERRVDRVLAEFDAAEQAVPDQHRDRLRDVLDDSRYTLVQMIEGSEDRDDMIARAHRGEPHLGPDWSLITDNLRNLMRRTNAAVNTTVFAAVEIPTRFAADMMLNVANLADDFYLRSYGYSGGQDQYFEQWGTDGISRDGRICCELVDRL